MGALKGNTGFVKFNSYIDLNDDTDPYNTPWSGLDQIGIADSPLADALHLTRIGYTGYSGAPVSYDALHPRLRCSDLNTAIPIGAVLAGIEVQTRAGRRIDPAYWYDMELQDNNNVIGNTKTPQVAYVPITTTNDPLGTYTQGSPTDNWGAGLLGFTKLNSPSFGFRFRNRITDPSSGSSTYGGANHDYVFGNYHWKNTGCMLAM
jgi:hypothetical protein